VLSISEQITQISSRKWTKEPNFMASNKDLKGPVAYRNENTRNKQDETAVPFYLDLETGKICADGYEPTPVGEAEQFNVHVDGGNARPRADRDLGKSKQGVSKRKITTVEAAQ
jgi:hypothetical protein